MSKIRRAWELMTLLLFLMIGQSLALLFGDWGWIYYYAAMGGMAVGRDFGWWGPLLGPFLLMWKIRREPLMLAQLAFQMQREVDEGEHPDVIRLHYAHLHDVVTAEAERRQPGVVRLAWQARRDAAAST